jgi:hypothetical protein
VGSSYSSYKPDASKIEFTAVCMSSEKRMEEERRKNKKKNKKKGRNPQCVHLTATS